MRAARSISRFLAMPTPTLSPRRSFPRIAQSAPGAELLKRWLQSFGASRDLATWAGSSLSQRSRAEILTPLWSFPRDALSVRFQQVQRRLPGRPRRRRTLLDLCAEEFTIRGVLKSHNHVVLACQAIFEPACEPDGVHDLGLGQARDGHRPRILWVVLYGHSAIISLIADWTTKE